MLDCFNSLSDFIGPTHLNGHPPAAELAFNGVAIGKGGPHALEAIRSVVRHGRALNILVAMEPPTALPRPRPSGN